MAEYANLGQLRARIPKAPATPEVDEQLTEILEAVSRAIDRYCGVVEGYFAPAGAPSAQILYGNGKSYLNLPHYLYGEVTVAAAAGVTVPNFIVKDKRLISLAEDGTRSPYIVWAAGVPFEVSGTWGFAVTPADIREATLQTGVRWWRGKDEAFSGVIGAIHGDNQIIERDLPAPVRTMLQNWRRKTKRVIFA